VFVFGGRCGTPQNRALAGRVRQVHEEVGMRQEPLVRCGVGRQVQNPVPGEDWVVGVQGLAPRL
jgi:hypothetical protein